MTGGLGIPGNTYLLKYGDQLLKYGDQLLKYGDQLLKYGDQLLKYGMHNDTVTSSLEVLSEIFSLHNTRDPLNHYCVRGLKHKEFHVQITYNTHAQIRH